MALDRKQPPGWLLAEATEAVRVVFERLSGSGSGGYDDMFATFVEQLQGGQMTATRGARPLIGSWSDIDLPLAAPGLHAQAEPPRQAARPIPMSGRTIPHHQREAWYSLFATSNISSGA